MVSLESRVYAQSNGSIDLLLPILNMMMKLLAGLVVPSGPGGVASTAHLFTILIFGSAVMIRILTGHLPCGHHEHRRIRFQRGRCYFLIGVRSKEASIRI